jgi:hypothetical protein
MRPNLDVKRNIESMLLYGIIWLMLTAGFLYIAFYTTP